MALPPEDRDTSSPSANQYQSFDGPEVKVDIDDLVDYFREMHIGIPADAAGPTALEVSAMSTMIREGLSQPGEDAGVFPEGAQAARLLTHRQSDFQYFFVDVITGITNIGSAAAVVAELYENSDNANAATLNDIAFALADPRAQPPAGFRPHETTWDVAQRNREAAGQNAMSVMGDDSNATVVRPASGVTIYFYPDGSSKQVVTTTRRGTSHTSDVAVTETTFYGPGATKIQTIREESYSIRGETQVRSTTTDRGDPSSVSTTTTSQHPNGTITVTNQTGSGEPTVTTVDPGDHNDSSDPGPVEEAEDRLDTHGTNETLRTLGRGY